MVRLPSPDESVENADWTKQSWDLPIETIEELREWIEARGMTVAQFKRLPVYQLNVERVAFLAEL